MSNLSPNIDTVICLESGDKQTKEDFNKAIHLIFKVAYSLKVPATKLIPFLDNAIISRHRLIL